MKFQFAKPTKIGGRMFQVGDLIAVRNGQVVDGIGIRIPEVPTSTFLHLKFRGMITPVIEPASASLCFA